MSIRLVGWLAVLLAPSLAFTAEQIWPQWRGPERTGRIDGPTWPTALKDEHLQQLWRVELGPSYSGPIVTAERVFVTETKDKNTEVVRALDRRTGKEIWQASWPGSLSVPFFAKANGDWIRATPAYANGRLYVAGMRDVLVCFDTESGKEIWRFDFSVTFKTPLPAFGFVCSPLVDGEHVYVQAGAAVCKLKAENGSVVWRSLEDGGGMWGSAFSSPIIATLAGQRQLIVQTREKLAGLDLESGKVLWSQTIPAFRGMNILTPIQVGDTLFTSAYGGKTFRFELKRTDDTFKLETLWTHRAEGYMSTPVVHDGHVYLHLRNQRLCCFDLKTGEQKWVSGQGFGKYWSMIAQGDRILGLDERGILFLLKANPEKLEILDQRRLTDQETWAHLAISDDALFIRELNAITAYRWK